MWPAAAHGSRVTAEVKEWFAAHFPPLPFFRFRKLLSIECGPAAVPSSAETQIQAEDGEDDRPQRLQPPPRGNSRI